MDVIEHLEQEHRKAEGLVAQLKESEAGQERVAALEELQQSLDTHMAVEEQFIYPIVQEVFDAEEREGADVEHDLTRRCMQWLFELQDRPGFDAALDMFEAGLSHHVTEEEGEIFPKLRSEAGDRLAQMDPEDLERQVESSGGSGNDGPTRDELYRRAQDQEIPGRSKMDKAQLAEAVDGES